MLAAAASSPADGASGSAIRASTKSTMPSPFLSWKTMPGLKISASEDGAVSAGAVRPTAPAAMRTKRETVMRFMADGLWLMAYGPWLMVQPAYDHLPYAIHHMPSAMSPQPWTGGASELEPHRELRLPRRRVDVGQERRALAEERTARRVVAGADVGVRRVEVRAVEDVEQLRDQLGTLDAEPDRL